MNAARSGGSARGVDHSQAQAKSSHVTRTKPSPGVEIPCLAMHSASKLHDS